ncbi:hypothetical protein [Pseudosulfitobacter pseudonitzschiae]|uniref:hypothetical protein n=1 Tax=Pseudosulfitobacter pseudonitzschiae TaxID=1402135 RepID=UPI001E306533|nr:hypothetical protein [Pseudosulfitobacter pseudonitzschiae]UFF15829.1 hypothetical protein LOE16_22610 [Pseudosulfitobacter pseudonitzschiae]
MDELQIVVCQRVVAQHRRFIGRQIEQCRPLAVGQNAASWHGDLSGNRDGRPSVRGSVTGRRIINELLPVFATENDSHLTGPVIVSLEGPFALHTITIKTKLGQFWPKDVS